MAKTNSQRVERLEGMFVAHTEICEQHFQDIKDHLATLNGDVKANSQFRIQQKAVYAVIAFAWISVLIPLTGIAIAVLL